MNSSTELRIKRPDITASAGEIAQALYQAYGSSAMWINYHGGHMPHWGDLPRNIQENWQAAAAEILYFPLTSESIKARLAVTSNKDPVVDKFTNERQSDIDEQARSGTGTRGISYSY